MKKIAILFFCFLTAAALGAADFTIIHTNDIHSHLLGGPPFRDYTPGSTGDDDTLGGMARIRTVIEEVRQSRAHPVLLFDGGDYTMGTEFHLRCREEAFELRLLHDFRYDALTLGNHEFDLKPEGLADMIGSAAAGGFLPPLVAANITFDPSDPADDSLEACFEEGWVRPYRLIEAEGTVIGVFGLLGHGAQEDSPFAKPLRFPDPVETAKETTRFLRDEKGADIVICLSHGALDDDPDKSEDEILAREVPGLDIIISGHSHTRTEEPRQAGGAVIVQAGSYGEYVGILDFSYDRDGTIVVTDYESVAIDDSIPGDPAVTAMIDAYRRELAASTLEPPLVSWDQAITETAFDLPLQPRECGLGNYLTDAMREGLFNSGAFKRDEALIALEANGLIRSGLFAGQTGIVTAADLFSVFPLGFGPDGDLGYPLLVFYLSGEDLKKTAEIVTTVAPLKNDDYVLQFSGVRFRYNPHRIPFDRVTGIEVAVKGGYLPVDLKGGAEESLYPVCINSYNAAMIGVVGEYTFGILDIVPRDRAGKPLTDYSSQLVDRAPEKPGVQEMKEWQVLLDFARQQPDRDGDGIPEIPALYSASAGRFVAEPSRAPWRLAGGTWVTHLVWGSFALLLALIILVPVVILRRRRKRKAGIT